MSGFGAVAWVPCLIIVAVSDVSSPERQPLMPLAMIKALRNRSYTGKAIIELLIYLVEWY